MNENPFDVMRQVILLCIKGNSITVSLDQKPMTFLISPDPAWQDEAPLIISGDVPMGLRDPLLRTVVVPMLQAERALNNDQLGRRRFDVARYALSRCQAEDWKMFCMNWVDEVEKASKPQIEING